MIDLASKPRTECSCDSCQNACKYLPGWFLPGEAEQAAAREGLSLEEFFRRFLTVDYWESGGCNVYVLRPRTTREEGGALAPYDPMGRPCVFFKAGRCEIHDVKPWECARLDCRGEYKNPHGDIKELWRDHQAQIYALLGTDDPQPEGGNPFDLLLRRWGL